MASKFTHMLLMDLNTLIHNFAGNDYGKHFVFGIFGNLIMCGIALITEFDIRNWEVALLANVVSFIFWVGKEIIWGLFWKIPADWADTRFSMYGSLVGTIVFFGLTLIF